MQTILVAVELVMRVNAFEGLNCLELKSGFAPIFSMITSQCSPLKVVSHIKTEAINILQQGTRAVALVQLLLVSGTFRRQFQMSQ